LKFSLIFSISMKSGDWQVVAEELLRANQIPLHARNRKNQHEINITGRSSVKKLIELPMTNLVVKGPIARELEHFPSAHPRNRFSSVNAVCEKVDFVRNFNKGKNRPRKWDGRAIRLYYEK